MSKLWCSSKMNKDKLNYSEKYKLTLEKQQKPKEMRSA